MVYLSEEQVLELHREALEAYGGSAGLRAPAQFSSAVRQAEQSAFGEDAYPTVAEKAAAYAYFIAEAQAFLDANKRTAAASMLVFLDLNGHELRQTDEEIVAMIVGIGSGVISKDEFFGWVSNHTRPKELEAARLG